MPLKGAVLLTSDPVSPPVPAVLAGRVYLVTVLAMILAVFFAQIHPHYLSKQWKADALASSSCSVAGYGLIPDRPLDLHHRGLLLRTRPGQCVSHRNHRVLRYQAHLEETRCSDVS